MREEVEETDLAEKARQGRGQLGPLGGALRLRRLRVNVGPFKRRLLSHQP